METFGVIQMLYLLIIVVGIGLYTFVNTHQILHKTIGFLSPSWRIGKFYNFFSHSKSSSLCSCNRMNRQVSTLNTFVPKVANRQETRLPYKLAMVPTSGKEVLYLEGITEWWYSENPWVEITLDQFLSPLIKRTIINGRKSEAGEAPGLYQEG